MARFNFPFLEGFSGRIGPVVVFYRNDKRYVRAYTVPRDPKTPAQLAQRAKLKLANQGLSPLSEAIRQGYRNNHKAYRSLVGKAIKEFIVGEYPSFSIDYSKIQLSEGRLLLPEHIEATYNSNIRQVSFRWDTKLSAASKWSRANDIARIVLFKESTLETTELYGVVKRSQGGATIHIPAGWNPKIIHCWIYFSSSVLEENSESFYLLLTKAH